MSRTGRPYAAPGRLLAAATGVLAVHQLAYLLAHPATVGREVAAQGHGYLTPVATALLPVAATVATWAVVCRLVAPAHRSRPAAVASTRDYAALFLAVELLERVAAGRPPTDAFAEPAVWLGLALVPLLGLAGRLLGRSLERVEATTIEVVVAPRPQLPTPTLLAPGLPVRTHAPTVRRVRGPPPLLR